MTLHPQSPGTINEFRDAVFDEGICFKRDVALEEYTTFRLGGNCPCLINCERPQDVIVVIQELSAKNIDFILIGGGSNLLISDEGITSVIVRYCSRKPRIKRDKDRLIVSGGTMLDEFVRYAVVNGIGGFVNCSGIPGTLGGAIAGNAGAFGWQIADVLSTIKVISATGKVEDRISDDIEFRYRYSELKNRRDIVLEATFIIEDSDILSLRREREKILNLRASKHPDISKQACAGSFFKNIEPTSAAERRQAAGWFLEQAGVKSMRFGGAAIYEKHANIIIRNSENCSSHDVFMLSSMMADAVKDEFGLSLEREVQLIGRFEGAN